MTNQNAHVGTNQRAERTVGLPIKSALPPPQTETEGLPVDVDRLPTPPPTPWWVKEFSLRE